MVMKILPVNDVAPENIPTMKQLFEDILDVLADADASNIAVLNVFASLAAASMYEEPDEVIKDVLIEFVGNIGSCIKEMRKSNLESN